MTTRWADVEDDEPINAAPGRQNWADIDDDDQGRNYNTINNRL